MRRVSLMLLFAGLATVTLACGGGGSSAPADDSVQAEGIAVHGDWRISIYNTDGSLDREYVFANALRPGAGDVLGLMLAVDNPAAGGNAITANSWVIVFGDSDTVLPSPVPGVSPCTLDLSAGGPLDPLSIPGRKFLLTTGCALATGGGSGLSGTVTALPIAGGVQLSGSATATQAGSIDYVETWLGANFESSLIAGNAFTGTTVGPFPDIEAGQNIQIQVDITFSSPTS